MFPEYLEYTTPALTTFTTCEVSITSAAPGSYYMVPKLCKFDLIAVAALACYCISVLPSIPHGISDATATILCFILTGVALASAILPGQVSGTARLVAIIAFHQAWFSPIGSRTPP